MTNFSRVLMVINPISGGKDKSDLIKEVRAYVEERGITLRIFLTAGKEDKINLRKEIESFDPERIFSVGGDGTIKLIAEILEDDSIPISIFPEGSANGLAENLNLPSDLSSQIQIALGNRFVYMDVILINEEYCLHISDMGLNAELIKNYQEGNIRGKLGYLIQSIPTLIGSDFPFSFCIKIGDRKIYREAVLIAIANAKKYGTGANINPQGKFDDGKFEILIFKEFDIPQILKTFRENVELSEDFLEIIPAVEAEITSERKIPFQIDGEYRGEATKVCAAIAPVKIKITVP